MQRSNLFNQTDLIFDLQGAQALSKHKIVAGLELGQQKDR